MKFILLILLLSFLSLLTKANECQNIVRPFFKQSGLKLSGKREELIRPFYLFSNRTFYPVHSINDESKLGIRVVDNYLKSENGHYIVSVSYFYEDPSIVTTAHNFSKTYRYQVEKNIDHVLDVYSHRRDWSQDFLKDVKAQAIRDADRTIYIEIKDEINDQNYNLWGTLKVIRSSKDKPYEELLPVEEALNIRLPFNHGLKFEPGNFSIDKDHYNVAMSQVLLQLSNTVKKILKENPQIDPQKDLFYTYADRESKLMYRSLGFKVTDGYKTPMMKDGKEWWVLSISGKDLADLPLRLKNTRGNWTDSDQKAFDELVKLFDSIGDQLNIDLNFASKNISAYSKRTPTKAFVSTSEEHLYRGVKVKKLAILFDKFDDEGILSLPIPTHLLPLQENSIIDLDDGITITYKHGHLYFNSKTDYHNIQYQLEIDANLSRPRELKFKAFYEKYGDLKFEAQF